MIPRISIWSQKVDIPFRLVERPVDDYWLEKQARAIQGAQAEILRIAPAAMYILSSIAGRRIMNPVRWVILDSLQDVLIGNLRTVYPERQDILGPTFGEVLGVLFLALKMAGDVEIVRLLEGNEGKVPDYLLLQTSNGQTTTHPLECKGVVGDVHNINDRQNLDVCQRIRDFRKDGLEQLCQGDLQDTGRRVQIRASSYGALSPSSINLSVSYIPDARILTMVSNQVEFASRACCNENDMNCLKCIDAGYAGYTNIVSVLHREEISDGTPLDSALRSVIAKYRSAMRDLWAEDDKHFTKSFQNLTNTFSDIERDATVSYLVVSLLEEATRKGFDVREVNTDLLLDLVTTDEQDRVESLRQEVVQRDHAEIPAIEYTTGADMIEYIGMQRDIVDHREEQSTQPGQKVFLRDELMGHRVNGTVTFQDNKILMRLTTVEVGPDAYEALKSFTENLIAQARGRSSSRFELDWRNAEVELMGGEKSLSLGECWDKYPYTHSRKSLPGITAWVSRYGRAEVIVRLDTPSRSE